LHTQYNSSNYSCFQLIIQHEKKIHKYDSSYTSELHISITLISQTIHWRYNHEMHSCFDRHLLNEYSNHFVEMMTTRGLEQVFIKIILFKICICHCTLSESYIVPCMQVLFCSTLPTAPTATNYGTTTSSF